GGETPLLRTAHSVHRGSRAEVGRSLYGAATLVRRGIAAAGAQSNRGYHDAAGRRGLQGRRDVGLARHSVARLLPASTDRPAILFLLGVLARDASRSCRCIG